MIQELIDAGHYWPGELEGDIGIRGYTLEAFERWIAAVARKREKERIQRRADTVEDFGYAARTVFAKPGALTNLIKAYRDVEEQI